MAVFLLIHILLFNQLTTTTKLNHCLKIKKDMFSFRYLRVTSVASFHFTTTILFIQRQLHAETNMRHFLHIYFVPRELHSHLLLFPKRFASWSLESWAIPYSYPVV